MIITPLQRELKVNMEVQKRLKADLDRSVKELKAMSAVLRLPAMTAQFQHMLRRKESEKQREAQKKKAISQMVQQNVTDNES